MVCLRARESSDEMADKSVSHVRDGEAFWRAHHEAWRRSELNQREYCESHGISLKAFGNWRDKFKAEPQPPVHRLAIWPFDQLRPTRGNVISLLLGTIHNMSAALTTADELVPTFIEA